MRRKSQDPREINQEKNLGTSGIGEKIEKNENELGKEKVDKNVYEGKKHKKWTFKLLVKERKNRNTRKKQEAKILRKKRYTVGKKSFYDEKLHFHHYRRSKKQKSRKAKVIR